MPHLPTPGDHEYLVSMQHSPAYMLLPRVSLSRKCARSSVDFVFWSRRSHSIMFAFKLSPNFPTSSPIAPFSSHSILNRNPHPLLRIRDHFILLPALQPRQLPHRLINNPQRSPDLFLRNHQRRRQPDNILMRRFRLHTIISVLIPLNMRNLEGAAHQQPLVLHQHTQIPRAVPAGLGLVDDDRVEQAFSADRFDHRI